MGSRGIDGGSDGVLTKESSLTPTGIERCTVHLIAGRHPALRWENRNIFHVVMNEWVKGILGYHLAQKIRVKQRLMCA